MRIGAVIGAGAVLLPLTAGNALASAANGQGTTDGKRIEVSASVPELVAADDDAQIAAACNRFTRTQICQKVKLTIRLWVNRKIVGVARLDMTQAIVFSTTSNKFRETLVVRPTVVTGSARILRTVGLTASCGQGCKAKASLPRGKAFRPGVSIKGKATFTDGVKQRKIHRSAVTNTFIYVAPGFTPSISRFTWRPGVGHRCDNNLYFPEKRRYVPGCVIPRFTPTMTTMRGLPAIRANIRRIQTNGPDHYGRPGSGHPLHRLWNAGKQQKNRQTVCGKKVVGNPPQPGLECDEYPFASTEEGGTKLRPADRGTAWVPSGGAAQAGRADHQGIPQRPHHAGRRLLRVSLMP
ncbi:hypothetical protein [Actinoallomurus sp. NPDC050550]|uniref:NucA/NucB deoxyribonuclease domain-containing protein n=1 Tax=Actinoallomurus sp. NPDC050550 TaxID=3154937 RepID=UPI0033D92221